MPLHQVQNKISYLDLKQIWMDVLVTQGAELCKHQGNLLSSCPPLFIERLVNSRGFTLIFST